MSVIKRILAIRTNDKEYGEELAKNFNMSEDAIFQTLVFTEEEVYNEFAKNNCIEVLLCDEDLLPKDKEDCGANLLLALSEFGSARETSECCSYIFKYQASEKIMAEILERYRKSHNIKAPQSRELLNRKKKFCICSPEGGSYSSTFALAYAKFCALKGKTLFISFDPFFTLPGIEKDPKKLNLSDVVFYSNADAERPLMDFLCKITHKNGNLECVNGVSHWFDLYDMDPKTMHRILEVVSNSEVYDNIVFDVGLICAASMEIFVSSDRIFVPVKNSHGSEGKLKEWKRQMDFCGCVDILDRVCEIRIPKDETFASGYEFEELLSGKLGRYIEEKEEDFYNK